MFANGILLFYYKPLWRRRAVTIWENIVAFQQHSRFTVWSVNTALGFPAKLRAMRFSSVVLHYSLFGFPYLLNYINSEFLDYLEQCRFSYKVAFFQDEHHFCQQRFAFLNRYKVDCVYTLVEPPYFKDTYQRYTSVPKLVSHIPGYVSDHLVERAQRVTLPDEKRKIDIGYRGRRLKYYMGKGSQEKYEIAVRFRKKAAGLGLKLDIEAEEHRRIYGEAWYRFVANCRACLGVEAGVSIFDIEDVVRTEYERLITPNPQISFEEMSEKILREWEDNIPYRTISPRHFEAAAFRVCQILFEGDYSGIMRPMVHYIPLKKDFSNFDDVICMFKDKALRRKLTENAHRDLIASGRYSYKRFIKGFDEELLKAGLTPDQVVGGGIDVDKVTTLLRRGQDFRKLRASPMTLLYCPFPGRGVVLFFVRPVLKPLLRMYRRRKYRRMS